MTHQIYPCLWFDNYSKVAAEFYCSVFKNSKIKTDTPMVVMFELANKKIMALNGGPMFKINPSISFFVECVSINETNETWDKLMNGGKALMQIDKYPWSER
jgi:predicted 3-demethylubiquinone-9 3-methyltransferase (glyoxalase superfamily)